MVESKEKIIVSLIKSNLLDTSQDLKSREDRVKYLQAHIKTLRDHVDRYERVLSARSLIFFRDEISKLIETMTKELKIWRDYPDIRI